MRASRRRGREQEDRVDAGGRRAPPPRRRSPPAGSRRRGRRRRRPPSPAPANAATPMCSIGIGVAHQHDRRAVVLAAVLLHRVEDHREPRAGAQRALRGALDGRAVGHRVGERHAQLDHVGAVRHERAQHAGERGRGDGSPAVTKGTSAARRSARSLSKVAAMRLMDFPWGSGGAPAAVRGQVPRPWRRCACPCRRARRGSRAGCGPWPRVGAIFIACATAWLDSSAGMMPSVRQSAWNAASASSSVTDT